MFNSDLKQLNQSISQSIRLGGIGRILLVDDDADVLAMSTELLDALGYEVAAFASVDEAVEDLERNPGLTDVVLTDFHMPDKNGVRLLRETQARDPLVVCILVTGFSNTENAIAAMRAGASDMLPKPCGIPALKEALARAIEQRKERLQSNRNFEDARNQARQHAEVLAATVDHLKTSYKLMLDPLVRLLEIRERMIGEHTQRVMEISVFMARQMGLDEAQVEVVRRGAMLHDVGKVAIPDSILLKKGPLDDSEWEVMRAHVEHGYEILKSNPYLQDVAELVYSHHERYDGCGYPRGLKGNDICLGARIFAVADAYDAIRSTRPYSEYRSAEYASEEIIRCSRTHFDPIVVKIFEKSREMIESIWFQHASEADLENGAILS
jgi:putative nucleotidyltransferase with HDIG domain